MGLRLVTFFADRNEVKKENPKVKEIRLREERVVKLLLYGPGEVGKTTILRRVMMIHGENDERVKVERLRFRPYICFNVVEGAYTVLKTSQVRFKLDFCKEGAKAFIKEGGIKTPLSITKEDTVHAQRIIHAYIYFSGVSSDPNKCHLNRKPESDLDPSVADGAAVVESILFLMERNRFFQKVVQKRSQINLYENWLYFAEKLKEYPRWGGPNWDPSDEDLLRSRIRTTGLNKFIFEKDKTKYELIDIGGQRGERLKFFNLFANVDCVLFVTSLADYDEVLFEDPSVNRLAESLNEWNKTAKNEDFKNIWIILFFNKVDLFRKKYYMEEKPIKVQFRGCDPAPTKEDEEDAECRLALKWFEDLFLSQLADARRSKVRPYVTSALDECNIENVMQLCVDFLLQKLIEASFRN